MTIYYPYPLVTMPRTALLLCGALAREVLALTRKHGWQVDCHAISAREHMTPARIAPLVEAKLRELLKRYERVAVVYGDCGTSGELDTVLQRFGVPRITGPHCYEMYAGVDFDALMRDEPGTFFLTDFLLRGFDGMVWKGLGLDRHPELAADYFHNYTRVVYLAQFDHDQLHAKAATVAARLGLPLEVRHTGCGALETRLTTLIEEMRAGAHAPRRAESVLQSEYAAGNPTPNSTSLELLNTNDDRTNSLLARHPVAGARARRPRARERRAERALPGSD